MRVDHEPRLRPRMQQAVEELKGLVREHYPDATFRVARSHEDSRIIHLMTTVDVPDTTEVVDTVLDRVLAFQIEENLPIHIIPIRPHERVVTMQHAARTSPTATI